MMSGGKRFHPMTGQTIAHYCVGEKIGAGGMGEVYQATDTKLNREVALKVLPEQFAKDADRMARFKREAQVLASLNHPNIAAIYGLEEDNGIHALVLELVEGPTLAERISEGAVPLEEALGIARQIADALEAAHDQGVIHRDLKPANVKVREDGQVKVLDFGLAKALEGELTEEEVGNSPTLSIAATRAGVILGTAAYMSPEQAKGKKADRRADVWAFGVVLFEMLTGKRLFTGENISEILAHVITKEPEWDLLPDDAPPAIRKLLSRTLQKNPKQRLQAIGEARIALAEYEADSAASVLMTSPAAAELPAWKRWTPWAAASAAMTVIALVTLWGWLGGTPPVPQPQRFLVEMSGEAELHLVTGSAAALSPDGSRIAYAATADSKRMLYVRPADQLEGTPLSGTEGAQTPFFSPDGQWIGFFTDRELKKVSVMGGAPITLCETQQNRGGAWGPDDTIIFAAHTTAGLSRIPATGGEPVEISTPGEEERSHRWPEFLPGGTKVLFTAQPPSVNFNEANIEVLDLESGERTVLHRGGTYPKYLPTGHVAYVHEGTLFVAPLDLDRLELTAPPAPIIEGIASNGANGGAQFAFSQNGHLLYFRGRPTGGDLSLVWVDEKGEVTPIPVEPRDFDGAALSPDGKRLAIDAFESNNGDVWVYDLERNIPTRFTFDAAQDRFPIWTPDGSRITFASQRDGKYGLYWKRSDGTGEDQALAPEGDQNQLPNSWSPDGKVLVYSQQNSQNTWDLWTLTLNEEGEPGEPGLFLQTPFSERNAAFSPDGRWIAYMSDESGIFEVYVRPYPVRPGKWQVSSGAGFHPRWSRKGGEIFYKPSSERLMSVPYSVSGDSFRAESPTELFSGAFYSHAFWPPYDAGPGGRQFLMLSPESGDAPETPQNQLTLVINWFEEVKRLTATLSK